MLLVLAGAVAWTGLSRGYLSPSRGSAGWGSPGFFDQGGVCSVVCISLLVAFFD